MKALHMRGVSLMEALVALVVMAFGMVGVVGVQSTLRTNSDISKQRSEAVRIANEAIEARRGFSVIDTSAGLTAYGDIVDVPGTVVSGYTTNTTYVLTASVNETAEPRMKTVTIEVAWDDRAGQAQGVRLTTNIAGTPPELGGTLSVPPGGLPTAPARARHPSIPPGALDQGDGTSRFGPPGGGDASWTFANTSGLITRVCVGGTCTSLNARLLAGYISFATDASQPTPNMAEVPSSPAFAVDVVVATTFPAVGSVACYEQLTAQYVQYYCAVPVDNVGYQWSGRSLVQGLPVAATIASSTIGEFKICRYTPVRGSHPVVPAISNQEHPLDYAGVSSNLTDQNFLVIRAGAAGTPFVCPADDAGTEFVNGSTWYHQPSS